MRQTTQLLAVLLCVLTVVTVPVVGATQTPANDAAAGVEPTALDSQETSEDCSFPVSRTDATGTNVTVDEEPERVVVLGPSAAQTLWEIDAQDRVVGMPVNQNTAYLNGSEDRENVVNDQGQPEAERVVALEPDLVLAPNIVSNESVTQLRDAGLTVYKADFGSSLEAIYEKTQLFGHFVGNCAEANQTVEETRSEVSEIRETVADSENPRVLYYFHNFTAGSGTFVDEVITAAGGNNVAADAGIGDYQQINPEIVADSDPEWVVVPSDAAFPEGPPYAETTAYQENNTLVVDANLMNQPAPRVVEPMRQLAMAFHPEAFDQGTETSTDEPTETESETDTETTAGDGGATTEDDGTTEGSGAGFGVAVTVVAALAAVLLGRRRS